MAFESWASYARFAHSAKGHLRYRLDPTSSAFLDEVIITCAQRQIKMQPGFFFWRAQRGYDERQYGEGIASINMRVPYGLARMKPRDGMATEGRVNPKGIPCLYMASHKETAIGEIRPWVGTMVSVAQFRLLKPVTVVDCTRGCGSNVPLMYTQEPGSEEREKTVWAQIDTAFSIPVNATDDTADYAPTQIISEAFKHHGLDGVIYRSALGSGVNVALFDIGAAEPVTCELYQVTRMAFEFEEAFDPWKASNPSSA